MAQLPTLLTDLLTAPTPPLPPTPLLALALGVLLAPWVEEVVFRLGVQQGLLDRGWRPWPTVLATALVFGLAHALLRADWFGLATALPALVLGGLYLKTRRVAPCAALHAVFNLIWWLAPLALRRA